MIKVSIGSTNPTKREAVKQAFMIVWPEERFEIETLDVPSGVNEQPLHEDESITGARNRAKLALDETEADYAVGIEGGMYEVDSKWFVSDWAVVIDRSGKEGIGGTPRYHVPVHLRQHITPDHDLSAVLEDKLGTANIGKLDGYAGLMTGNHITRTTSNRDAVIIALAPFIRTHYSTDHF